MTDASTIVANFLIVQDITLVDNSTGVTLEINPLDSTDAGGNTGWFTPHPTVTNVTSSSANGSYGMGSIIPIQVTFSAAVSVTGIPRILLETGGRESLRLWFWNYNINI